MAKRSVDIVVQAHDRASKNLGKMEKRFGGFGRMLKGVAAGIGVYFGGRALVGMTKGLLSAASDAEEVRNKFDVVFGETAQAVNQWAEEYAQATGFAQTEVRKNLSALQDTFVPLGYSRDEAAGLSEQLVELVGDMGSFSNANPSDVLRDMQSAMVGNHETLRKYGVIITESALKQEAQREGLARNVKEMTAQEKVAARLSLIMKGTSDAQGDLARTQDSFANQLRRLKGGFQDVKETLGSAILPIFRSFLKLVNDNIGAVKAFAVGAVNAFRNLLRGAVKAFTAVQVVVTNWKKGLQAAVALAKASLLGWVLDVKHWFTEVLPGYIEWFADNWVEVLKSAVDAVGTIFRNMGDNVVAIFKNLPDLIRGKVDLADLWTPLLDGFEATFDALPEIAGRKLTENERALLAQAAQLGGDIGDEIQKKTADRLAALGLGKPAGGGAATPGVGGAGGGSPGEAAVKAAAYSPMKAFESMMGLRAPGQDPMKQQIALSKRMAVALEKVEKHTDATEQNTKPQGGGTWQPAPVY